MKTLSVNCASCGISFQKSIAYIKYGEKRGYFNHFCSNKCSTVFANLKFQQKSKEKENKYYLNPKKCPNCQSPIEYKDKSWKTYCSVKCGALYTQKDGGHATGEDRKNKISETLKRLKPKSKRKCLECGNDFECIPSNKTKCCSHKCSGEWIRKTGFLKGKSGGYREKGGRGKQGWYKGYYCQSSWELAWLIYQLEHGVIPERNKEGFKYSFDARIRTYYPDFKIGDEYYEIKGYHSKQVDAKTQQFPHKLKVLHKSDLKEIFDYVEQKYGKDYTQQYETKN